MVRDASQFVHRRAQLPSRNVVRRLPVFCEVAQQRRLVSNFRGVKNGGSPTEGAKTAGMSISPSLTWRLTEMFIPMPCRKSKPSRLMGRRLNLGLVSLHDEFVVLQSQVSTHVRARKNGRRVPRSSRLRRAPDLLLEP